MSMEFPETFDPATEEGNKWDLIPPGEYVAEIIEAKVAPPQSGDGYGLTLVWKILEGDYENRQIWQYLSYLHSNQQAQTIARKTLKDICVALGIDEQLQSAEPFLYKPARIRVGIKADKNAVYDDKNVVSRVKALEAEPQQQQQQQQPLPMGNGNKPASASLSPRTQGTPRPGPSGSAPWHRTK
jgi:hypothetical protein